MNTPVNTLTTVEYLCMQIALALGDDWTCQPGQAGWYANLVRADGLNLWCRQDYKRMSIRPEAVEALDEHGYKYCFHHEQPVITVAMNRAPGAIAGSIRSRLLPDAETWWQAAQQWREKTLARRTTIEAFQQKILAFPGANLGRTDGAKVYGPNWTCDPTERYSALEFRELKPDLAVTLLQTYYQHMEIAT